MRSFSIHSHHSHENYSMNRKSVFDSCCQREIPYEYLRLNDQITPTALKENLGSENFIEVYCQTCKPIQKLLIGCDSKLKGPGNLWIDPKKSNIQLTQINDIQRVQALTHQAILKIGEEIEKKIAHENSKVTKKAIQETLEFAKFEADERIKFHIENITEKLRGECENRISELVAQHEETLIKFYKMNSADVVSGEGRMRQNDDEQVMRDKCQREVKDKDMTSRAHAGDDNNKNNDDDDDKLMRNSRDCDEKLSHYISTSAHHEQMRNTLLNLEVERCCDDVEKMKNECLKAMNLQRELMLSRHITEIMHLIAIIRQQDKLDSSTITKQKDESLHDSIKCNENAHKLNQVKNIFDLNEFTENPSSSSSSSSVEFTEWKEKQRKSLTTNELQQQRKTSTNLFTDSVLNRFIEISSQHEHPFRSHEDTNSNSNKTTMGGGDKSILPSTKTMAKKIFHPSSADVDDVLLPTCTEASKIKNSLEVLEQKRRVSMNCEQNFFPMTNNLLATVDSLELISSSSRTTTKSFDPSSNNKKDNLKSHQLMLLSKLPPYMRITPHSHPHHSSTSPSKIKLFTKMSENYSNVLVDDERRKSSKVRFSETSDDNGKTLTILLSKNPRGSISPANLCDKKFTTDDGSKRIL